MSSIRPALTSDEQTALSGQSQVRVYLLGMPMVSPYATAQVNQSSFTYPIKDITVDNASANWTNAKEGMLLWHGSSSGSKNKGVHFCRKAPGATTAFLNEMGRADSGLLATNNRTAAYANDDHLTIWERYNLHAMRSKIVHTVASTTGTFYKNTDTAYTTQHETPEPYIQCTRHQAKRLASGASTTAITLTVVATPFRAAQSVASYSWTGTTGWSDVTGANTATLSGNAPQGFYVIYCDITLNDGTVVRLVRYVWVDDANWSTYATQISEYDLTLLQMGGRGTVRLGDDLRENIDTENMVILVKEITYTDGTVSTASTVFIGWLNGEQGDSEYGKRGSTLEIVSPSYILQRLGADSQQLDQASDPVNWQQAVSELMTSTYFLWQLGRWGVTNLWKLFSYYPIESSVPQTVNPFVATESNYYEQMKNVGLRTSFANVGCDSEGDFHVRRHPSMIDPSLRGSIPVRDSFDADDLTRFNYTALTFPPVRHVKMGGFSYDGTTMVAYLSQAPSKVTGQGSGQEQPTNQIVESQSHLNNLCGWYYGTKNPQYPTMTFVLPGARCVYEPAHMSRVQFNVAAQYSPNGVAFSGYGVITQVVERMVENGAMTVEVTVEPETEGVAGKTLPLPPAAPSSPYGDFGDISPLEIPGSVITLGVQTDFSPATATYDKIKFVLLAKDASGSGFRVVLVEKTSGGWNFRDISPTSAQRTTLGAPIKIAVDTRNPKKLWLECESAIAYTNNCTATTVVWTVITSANSPAPYEDNLTTAMGAKSHLPSALYPFADWVPTSGGSYESTGGRTGGGCIRSTSQGVHAGAEKGVACLVVDLGGEYIITAASQWDRHETGVGVMTANIYAFDQDKNLVTSLYASGVIGANTSWVQRTFSGAQPGVRYVVFHAEHNFADGYRYLDDVSVTYSIGTNMADIAISRGGNVYWLSKQSIGGTDYIFCNFTRDNFKKVSSTQVARYNANMNNNIQISPFNPAYVWVSAGSPADGDAKIYFSSTGAVAFAAGATLNTRGGLFRLPRALLDGSLNKQHKNIVYVKGIDTNLQGVRDGSSPATIASGSSDYPQTGHALNSFALDASYVLVGLKSRDVYKSDDGGESWSFVSAAPGTGNLYSLEVWPTNKNYVTIGGDQAFAYSTDRAANWTNLWATYETWRNAQYGGTVARILLNALPMLFTVYPKPVL